VRLLDVMLTVAVTLATAALAGYGAAVAAARHGYTCPTANSLGVAAAGFVVVLRSLELWTLTDPRRTRR
jgi:hypothetical protein